MATVHFGRLLGPIGFSKTVAIKRLHPQFAKDPDFVAMFLDEARVAGRIQHPNVVSTLDVVALEGELFLVMEYIEGESLARLIRVMRASHTRLPLRVVGSIMTGALYGLHAAHEARSERGEELGIIHRDVSPQNIIVGIDGVARVLDFGIAKARGRSQTTRDGQVKGKLSYMPPEQILGEEIDRRVDIYAAGVVAWEALTCQRLFDGENEGVIVKKIVDSVVQPPSMFVPDLPPRVDEAVMRALSRDPADRFDSAWEFAVALEESLGLETPRRVGAFVEACAREAIARRAVRVQQLESMATEVDGGRGFGPNPSAVALAPAVAREPNRRAAFAVGAILGLGVMGAVAVMVAKRPDGDPVVAAGVAEGVAAPATSAVVRAGDAPSAPPLAVPTPTEAVASAPESAIPVTRAVPRPTGVMTGRPTVTATAVKASNCEPPYYLENGIRKIKPECLK
ncbi:MAG: protein kinase [Myxococcales bacterium]|nr:protein kinase [Myxococcales bacterium]